MRYCDDVVKYVDAAELVDRGVDDAVELVHVGHVDHSRGGLAAGGADLLDDGVVRLLGPAGDDDLGASCAEAEGHGAAQAARPTGDDGNASGDVEGVVRHGAMMDGRMSCIRIQGEPR